MTAVNPTRVRRRIRKILINSSTCFRCCASEALVRTGLSGNMETAQNQSHPSLLIECYQRATPKWRGPMQKKGFWISLTEGRQLAGKYALSCSRDISSRYQAVTGPLPSIQTVDHGQLIGAWEFYRSR